MNTKIVVLAFIMFAGSVGYIHASGQRDGGGKDAFRDNNESSSSGSRSWGIIGGWSPMEVMQTVVEIKAMDKRTERDSKGLSTLSRCSSKNPVNPPYVYYPKDNRDCLKDVLRNLPEFGGPANALTLVHEIYLRSVGTQSLFSDYDSVMVDMMKDLYRFEQNNH